jgi:hypothetical protein
VVGDGFLEFGWRVLEVLAIAVTLGVAYQRIPEGDNALETGRRAQAIARAQVLSEAAAIVGVPRIDVRPRPGLEILADDQRVTASRIDHRESAWVVVVASEPESAIAEVEWKIDGSFETLEDRVLRLHDAPSRLDS